MIKEMWELKEQCFAFIKPMMLVHVDDDKTLSNLNMNEYCRLLQGDTTDMPKMRCVFEFLSHNPQYESTFWNHNGVCVFVHDHVMYAIKSAQNIDMFLVANGLIEKEILVPCHLSDFLPAEFTDRRRCKIALSTNVYFDFSTLYTRC